MATVRVTRCWPDGDGPCVEVKVDASFPDAVAEAKAAAMSTFAEACNVVLAPEAET